MAFLDFPAWVMVSSIKPHRVLHPLGNAAYYIQVVDLTMSLPLGCSAIALNPGPPSPPRRWKAGDHCRVDLLKQKG